jgi:hypothetical protein
VLPYVIPSDRSPYPELFGVCSRNPAVHSPVCSGRSSALAGVLGYQRMMGVTLRHALLTPAPSGKAGMAEG